VSSFNPADGTTGVSTNVNPVILFDQAMDASTFIDEDKQYIALCTNLGCGAADIVTTSINVSSTNETDDTVTIIPDSALSPSTDYYINVGPQVENACGTQQGMFVRSQFTTAP
jgi:hypothetical protein